MFKKYQKSSNQAEEYDEDDNYYGGGGGHDEKDGLKQSQANKKAMTDLILKELDNISEYYKSQISKKNKEIFSKYTPQYEGNYTRLDNVYNNLLLYRKDIMEGLTKSKLGETFKAYAKFFKDQTEQFFTRLNKIIHDKTISIQANVFIDEKVGALKHMRDEIVKNIEIFNKLGCCDCCKKCDVENLLRNLLPECQRIFVTFLECLAKMEGLPSKQEYLDQDIPSQRFRDSIISSIDRYFHISSGYVPPPPPPPKVQTKNSSTQDKFDPEVIYVDKGNAEDFMSLAHEQVYGIGQPQQVNAGIKNYEKEIKKMNLKAYNCLGQLYLEGKVVDKDLNKSYQYYKKSSEGNDAEGLYRVGTFYEKGYLQEIGDEGMSEKERFETAIEYYQYAAQKRHQDALVDLGYLFENGLKDSEGNVIVNQNLNEAQQHYQQVDLNNSSRACNNLGTLYLKQNKRAEALQHFEKAHKMGNSSGALNLGLCYLKGLGVKIDLNKSLKYLDISSKKGNEEAQLQYSYLLMQNSTNQSSEEDFFQASCYLRDILIKNHNNSDALLYLGFLHEQGLGVAVDTMTALRYYEKSADLNNSKALNKLGDIYFSGVLVPKNVQLALHKYNQAADLGDPTALQNIGAIYEEGFDGQPPDYERAYTYYVHAANKGSSEAWTLIGMMIESSRKKGNTPTEGYEAFCKAIEMGSHNSRYIMKAKVYKMHTEEVEDSKDTDQLLKRQFLEENENQIMDDTQKLEQKYISNIINNISLSRFFH